MLRRDKETTPLLWPNRPQFPGSGAFPAVGQLPQGQQFFNPNFNYQYLTNQGSAASAQNTKKIFHDGDLGKDPHSQFCALTGCPPTNAPPGFKYKLNTKTLYGRAIEQVNSQNFTYQLTAALTNTLLLLQIVLGAALTGLGGAGVPPYVITLFGAANTIIAGIVAYLKSRGQPMRARMFRDDLERVVDEMENSEVMWLGISKGVHGYDDIDTDTDVTVRSEVARLTRLLDKAIRTNSANNPDLYSAASTETSSGSSGMRGNPFLTLPAVGIDQTTLANIPPVPVKDPDAAPATSSKSKKEEEERKKKEAEDKAAAAKSVTTPAADKPAASSSTPAPAATPAATPAAAKPEETKTEDKGKEASAPDATNKPSVSATEAPKPPSDPDASPTTSFTRKKSAANTTTSSGSGGNTTTTTYRSSSNSGGGETSTFTSSSGFGSGFGGEIGNRIGGGFSALVGSGDKTTDDSNKDGDKDGKN